MTIVRSKICGITRVEDALAAVHAGADAIGLVFYPKSPRAVSLVQAQAIVRALPPFVTTVGLFVNKPRAELNALLAQIPLDVLQFHGDETPEDCSGHGRPWFKAVRVQAETDLLAQMQVYQEAQAILLDTFVAGQPGGTGQIFDWSLIPKHLPKPIILAGGLTADNVRQAIAEVQPYAVDVSGGVEHSKGIKDPEKMRAFIAQVRQTM
ncbi:phosphoribosylanthranilate isomerase [Azomonas agilis]|uniref:N-(5'-phosphoribosyl)anthranilate isomerase n=1 Tax=Azomonas agilis TaxID=116849 RepID=A0A562J050_9GAMM|nr:phosphoribosylanthranilate isomerase [Azomonas agilis]TWH76556.1 phosphoribosylanthranilate isomerase [Azomonas agilis]